MAARHNPRQSAATRERIRAAQLVTRLQAFALGEADPQTGRPVVMAGAQVTAALTLLRRVLPDLAAVKASAPGGGPMGFVIYGEREAGSATAWQQQHAPPPA